jgi:hypothetical protein
MFNLLVGWALMWGLYVIYMRGYSTPDPSRAAGISYRQRVGDRFGLLPPSKTPIGVLLWTITALGFVAAIAIFLVSDRYVGAANGSMLGAFMLTLWRDNRWLKRQPDYQKERDAALAAAEAKHADGLEDDANEGPDD